MKFFDFNNFTIPESSSETLVFPPGSLPHNEENTKKLYESKFWKNKDSIRQSIEEKGINLIAFEGASFVALPLCEENQTNSLFLQLDSTYKVHMFPSVSPLEMNFIQSNNKFKVDTVCGFYNSASNVFKNNQFEKVATYSGNFRLFQKNQSDTTNNVQNPAVAETVSLDAIIQRKSSNASQGNILLFGCCVMNQLNIKKEIIPLIQETMGFKK